MSQQPDSSPRITRRLETHPVDPATTPGDGKAGALSPSDLAEFLADQIAVDDFVTVRGPVDDVFIEGNVDLVELAKALMQRFDITERPTE